MDGIAASSFMAPSPGGVVLVLRDSVNEWHGRGVNLAVISIIFSTFAVGLVVIRLASRFDYSQRRVKGIGSDDVAIVGSLVRVKPMHI